MDKSPIPERLTSPPQLLSIAGVVWILLDWEQQGVHYLLDPLTNTIYSHDDWPQPVGYLTCVGADKAASLHFQGPRTTLAPLTRRLSCLVRRDDHDHQHVGLPQAPARMRQDEGPPTGYGNMNELLDETAGDTQQCRKKARTIQLSLML